MAIVKLDIGHKEKETFKVVVRVLVNVSNFSLNRELEILDDF